MWSSGITKNDTNLTVNHALKVIEVSADWECWFGFEDID